MDVSIDQPGNLSKGFFLAHFNKYVFNYPCETQTICQPYQVTVPKSKIRFQLWGANGGASKSNPQTEGGKGGYSEGTIVFNKRTTLYLYVGAGGEVAGTTKTFGGGGRGTIRNVVGEDGYCGGSGGGASDVRLAKETDPISLDSRIIVAGGGAGSERYSIPNVGGYGGGFFAGDGNVTEYSNMYTLQSGKGATISAPGSNSFGSVTASAGKGGDASTQWGSGGGGGYFGGGEGLYLTGIVGTGGGGSSFISGIDECPIITYGGVPYIFISGSTIPGNQERPHRSCITNPGETECNDDNNNNGQIIISFMENSYALKTNLDLFWRTLLIFILYQRK